MLDTGAALRRLTGDPALSLRDEGIHYFMDGEVLGYLLCLVGVDVLIVNLGSSRSFWVSVCVGYKVYVTVIYVFEKFSFVYIFRLVDYLHYFL